MDIPRIGEAKRRRKRRAIFAVIGLVALAGITMGLMRLPQAAPSVPRGTLYFGTVKKGEMLRQVRGNGTLLPEEIRWVPAVQPGRIERILVLPGAEVKIDTVLIELSNPELEQAAFEAKWALRAAEADLENTRVTLESQRLTQEAATATLKSQMNLAILDAAADAKLAEEKLVADLTAKRSRANADELKGRYEIELKRLEIANEAIKAQVAVQQARVEQLGASYRLKEQQVESLKVRAGIDGVLQRLGDTQVLQRGQQIAAGANLARVANPNKLKAEIRIAETQARDIQFGQSAEIDTRNGTIKGKVVRIDPAPQNGTVGVDVALEGPYPRGSRPDLTVDGTIQLERLDNVLYVERMVHGQSDSTVGVFKTYESGRMAKRTNVKLGRTSVSFIEVLDGLSVGDEIILQDMSQYDSHDRLRLN
ncbi:MAG TPA: HlyD family efflux transporter periplasmic adaptor subunit [Verrucomicrobiae bacterium]|nr:HlyD family efflux transporter periplasmic adaptor subunit [Verrucomicrobiae bacterium]